MNPSIWCGIPVFNNSATIFDIARQCREQVANVLVIDDGSTDADLTTLLKSLDVVVIQHPVNRGKGEALLTAFRHAAEHGAEYLITLDGDGQHFPSDIPRFFPHISPDTILIGYRDEVTGEMPKSSRFGREFSDFWIRLEAGGNARDTQSGFRAYPLAAVLQLQTRSHFYNFEMEIITKALWAGLRVEGVPIRVWYPPAQHRVSSFDPFRDNLRISLLHTRLVLRQILPIPHSKIRNSPPRRENAKEDAKKSDAANAVILAVSAALSIIMGIVLWPWGIVAIVYVTIRWHLNKIIALVCLAICMPPMVPEFCARVGKEVVKSEAHPHLRWIVGSHVVALPAAVVVGCLVYAVAHHTVAKS
jgi:glycosyltransferase involved in cell wall biosynthesis